MNAQIDTLENWNEIRTAYHVARLGTLSAAAEFLGVHHATVIRHIDALETQLQSKLFHRHPRGYMPTEAGRDLMQVAATIEDQFSQLGGRLRGKSATVSGELVITTLSGLSPQFTPMLVEFQKLHPELRISLVADERRLKLEYGEAHVALRAGQKPEEPDNVVQLLCRMPLTLYAHKSYVDKHGLLLDDEDAKTISSFCLVEVTIVRPLTNGWSNTLTPRQWCFVPKKCTALPMQLTPGRVSDF